MAEPESTEISDFVAVMCNGKVYVIGGMNSDERIFEFNRVS